MDAELRQGAVNALEKLIQRTKDELKGLEISLKALRGTFAEDAVSPPTSDEWEHVGVTEATVRWLAEFGPSATRDIAEGIRDRGVRSQSKKFSSVVYATMKNAKKTFERTPEGLWGLTPEAQQQASKKKR